MSYERALIATRELTLNLPDFESIFDAAARDRTARLREANDSRTSARRWLLVAAASWLLLPLDAVPLLLFDARQLLILGASEVGIWQVALEIALMVAPPAAISLWGVHLAATPEPSFRKAILVRAIAASNLIVALLYAISVGGMVGALFSSLLALSSARTIQRLGSHGLDPSDDPTTPFTPTRFRGVLILALILAFADALTLSFSSSVVAVRFAAYAISGAEYGGPSPTPLVLTLLAAVLMLANVWGLLRLRTWALASNILCNVGVAALAVGGLLATNLFVALGLAATAAVQLLATVPILATALGDRDAGRTHANLAWLVRWVVPGLAVATIVIAAFNFGPALPKSWAFPHWP